MGRYVLFIFFYPAIGGSLESYLKIQRKVKRKGGE
ncbi:hypothetical protein SAMN04488168_101132 [Bacillus sp. 491mf]|nr:hypothetical protein SAMN04488168_101132 [Bacillus sp. 491mf]